MRLTELHNPATAAAGALVFFAAGILGGVLLVTMLPGMPWSSTIWDATGNLDLAAQRSMAAAAWYMCTLTVVGTSLGAASLYLIRENLKEARKLTREAATSTKAAEDGVRAAMEANETARQIGMAQARAYITVQGCTLTLSPTPIITATLVNSGQSPARTVSLQNDASMTMRSDAEPEQREVSLETRYFPDIAAGDTSSTTFSVGTGLWKPLEGEGEIVLELLGPVENFTIAANTDLVVGYKDVFDVWHEERISFRIRIPPAVGGWSVPQQMHRVPAQTQR